MVGVQDVHTVSTKQMAWLQRGGRETVYKLIEEMEAKLRQLGLLYDFSGTIWLPTDFIVFVRHEGKGGVFWTFGERSEAEKFAEELANSNPEAKISVEKASRFHGIKGNTIMTDFTWHGDEGASIIFALIDQLFDAVEEGEGKDPTRLETIVSVHNKLLRLPFFVPQGSFQHVLKFAKERTNPGDFLILQDKSVYVRDERDLRKATSAEIAELFVSLS